MGFAIAGGNGGGWRRGGGIDDRHSRAGPLAGYARGVVAGLVADVDGKRSGAGGGGGGKSSIKQEDFIALEEFRFGVEGGVEDPFWNRLQHAHQSAGGNLESGGNTGGGRKRGEMPAGIDLGGGADPDGGAGRGRRWVELEGPGGVLLPLGEGGSESQEQGCDESHVNLRLCGPGRGVRLQCAG